MIIALYVLLGIIIISIVGLLILWFVSGNGGFEALIAFCEILIFPFVLWLLKRQKAKRVSSSRDKTADLDVIIDTAIIKDFSISDYIYQMRLIFHCINRSVYIKEIYFECSNYIMSKQIHRINFIIDDDKTDFLKLNLEDFKREHKHKLDKGVDVSRIKMQPDEWLYCI